MKNIIRTALVLLLVVVGGLPARASAVCGSGAQTCSSSYQVNEVFIGSGGQLNSCSTNFCSKQAAGETAVGRSSSTNFAAQAGFNTDRQPFIQFIVNNTNLDIGTLSATSTKTANATFSVETYLASGYIVTNASPPPSNNGYTMAGMVSAAASSVGTEQFGINLVHNTAPTTFGSDPSYLPDSSFSFGQVSSGYNTTNVYKYVQGDTVAYSNSSSSSTNYTVSYIFNISNVTPGGTYVLYHVLVATSTY